MDRFDFSPLFRSTIGFDRLTRLVDAATRADSAAVAYPPYNIEKTGEDAYRLTMAVAELYPYPSGLCRSGCVRTDQPTTRTRPPPAPATDRREYIPRVARPPSCALRSGQDESRVQCIGLRCG